MGGKSGIHQYDREARYVRFVWRAPPAAEPGRMLCPHGLTRRHPPHGPGLIAGQRPELYVADQGGNGRIQVLQLGGEHQRLSRRASPRSERFWAHGEYLVDRDLQGRVTFSQKEEPALPPPSAAPATPDSAEKNLPLRPPLCSDASTREAAIRSWNKVATGSVVCWNETGRGRNQKSIHPLPLRYPPVRKPLGPHSYSRASPRRPVRAAERGAGAGLSACFHSRAVSAPWAGLGVAELGDGVVSTCRGSSSGAAIGTKTSPVPRD